MKAKILLNALHAKGGGGLIYLQGVLPSLAADKRFDLTLLIPEASWEALRIPNNVAVITLKAMSFWRTHWWEQFVLSWWVKRQGFAAVLCNANYVPLLLARRSIPIVHTTPRAAGQARGWKKKLYWRTLKILTTLEPAKGAVGFLCGGACLWILPNTLARYRGKVRVAYPAVNRAPVDLVAASREPGRLVAMGDFWPHKDYVTLVQAVAEVWKQVPGVKLTIIGCFVDDGVEAEVCSLINELGLGDVVELTGGLAHADAMVLLRQATCLVSTSLAECFNMPVLEALSAGVPVVCADLPCQHEVAGDAAVYVPAEAKQKNVQAYAAAIAKVLWDDRLRERMCVAGEARQQNSVGRQRRPSWRRDCGTGSAA